jgi:hypothetical protein
MDYTYERRHRRRRRGYKSPSSHDTTPRDDDDDDIEQEIIERYEDKQFFRIKICFIRAMEIERSREKSLRRQFEYIVHSVKVSSFISLYTNICFFKELERRRQQRRRTKSPEYYEKTISPSRRRHLHSHSVENKIHK